MNVKVVYRHLVHCYIYKHCLSTLFVNVIDAGCLKRIFSLEFKFKVYSMQRIPVNWDTGLEHFGPINQWPN